MGKFTNWLFGEPNNDIKNEVKEGTVDITSNDTTIKWLDDEDSSSKSITEDKAMQIPAFASCLDLICSNIAYLPVKLYKNVDGEKIEITDDYRLKLLNVSNNQFDSSFNLLYGIAKNLCLYGVAYVYIEKDRRNKVQALYFLPTKSVSPQLIKVGNQYSYKFSFSHFQDFKTVNSDEVIVINRDLNSSYEIDGIGVLEKGATILNLALDEMHNSSDALGNKLSAYLSTPNSLSKQAKENIRNSFKGLSRSKNNQIPIFEESLTYNTTSLNPQELELLEARKFSSEAICQLFQIPFTYVLSSATSYNNSEQESIRFVKSLTPYLTAIEKSFQRYLLTESEIQQGLYFEFDVTKLLKISTVEMGDYLKGMVQAGLMSPNEARKELGLQRVDGADFLSVQVNTYQLIGGKVTLPSMEQEDNKEDKNEEDKNEEQDKLEE